MAFITAETRSDLIELSVAMLKQAPSAALLEELIALSVGGGSLADAADHIAKTAAFKAEYPSFQTAEQYAAEIFDNITTGGTVTADIRTAVIELATGMLTSGSVTKAGLALAIAEYLAAPAALLNTDFADIAQSFQNRADAAEYFVVTKELGGSTDAELAAAIASVTSDAATLTAANTAADATASAEAVVAGQTFTLTTGLDTPVGGGANDTFVAQDNAGALTNTLTTGDTLNGGAGTDTLMISASGTPAGGVTNGVATSNIEAVSVYNNSTAAYEVDAALMSGLTDVYINGGVNSTLVDDVDTLANLHLISTNVAAEISTTAAAVTGSADEAVILSNNSALTANVTATYDGVEVINFAAAGTTGAYSIAGEFTGANRTLTLDSDALEKVVVTGDANASIAVNLVGAALETQTSELDASAAGGSITAEVTKGASATAAVTMSAQADHLDFNGALANTITLDGGDGIDTLELDTDLAYSTAAATAGTAQAGAGVSNFEALYLASGTDVDERALTNNAGITTVVAVGAASYAKATALASVTQLSTGAFTTTAATDGDADALSLTLAGGATSTLSAANVETLTVASGGAAANAVTMSKAGSADLTSVTAAGTRGLSLTVSGTSLATVDASGITGVGSAFTLSAAASDVDMTVTASGNRPTVAATGIANTITVGDGDNTITGGAYRDDITAGNGDNTITAGDGNNVVTTGRGDDTITAGDGDNTINAGSGDNTVTVGDGDNGLTLGNGDDTVTTGGTTTSATVMDVNTVGLGAGDDTFTGGAGRDVVTMGTGDDTVDTGAGADSIYMSDYDDDDVVNGGAGTDALSASALASATAQALTGAQIQAVGVHVDVTPGTTRTSSPQITGVESVYINANLAALNDGAVLDRETIDFTAATGISNLYLVTTDADAANSDSTLILNEVDAAAIHLQDDGAAAALGQLTVVGTGQASLTLKGHDMADSTDLVVTEVDALTVTSYVDNATAAVTDTVFGNITADESAGITVTGAGVSAVIGAQAFTTGTISADAVETLTLSAGSNMTLTTGAIDTAGDELATISLTADDDGSLVIASITATAGDIEASTLTIDVGVGSTMGANAAGTTNLAITADSIEAATITLDAASTAAFDLLYAGATTIAMTTGSVLDLETIGVDALVSSTTLTGRGTLNGAIDLLGTNTFNFSGFTSTGGALAIDAGSDDDNKVIVSNDLQNTYTLTGGGKINITTGAADDTISTGANIDTISTGAGADIIDGGGLGDVINGGLGNDVIHIDADTDSQPTATTQTTLAGIDVVTLGTGDTIDLNDYNATAVIGATATVQTVTLAAGAEATIADLITGLNTLTNLVNEVTIVEVVDNSTDTTGDGDFSGFYLIANDAAGAAISAADDVIIKLVGVDDESLIAGVSAGDIVSFTL